MLLQHKDRVLERKLALIKLWGEDTPFTARSMDVYVTRLRKFFKADPSIEIINIRGIGYSLIEAAKK
jgi:DNA-binding response OmpR family regulator